MFIRVILLVNACGALALMVNVLTGMSSIPGGYTMTVAPNSPRHKIKESTNAVNKDGIIKGRSIFKNILLEGMPITEAASPRETGICLILLPMILEVIKPNFPT